ncbi:hypothetical protein CPT_MarsHill_154 [Staphylococcus phage MarsHill]|nr:hypothetical protein CPT_MarsHill_154 [Staphylococcus phage MarsHill]
MEDSILIIVPQKTYIPGKGMGPINKPYYVDRNTLDYYDLMNIQYVKVNKNDYVDLNLDGKYDVSDYFSIEDFIKQKYLQINEAFKQIKMLSNDANNINKNIEEKLNSIKDNKINEEELNNYLSNLDKVKYDLEDKKIDIQGDKENIESLFNEVKSKLNEIESFLNSFESTKIKFQNDYNNTMSLSEEMESLSSNVNMIKGIKDDMEGLRQNITTFKNDLDSKYENVDNNIKEFSQSLDNYKENIRNYMVENAEMYKGEPGTPGAKGEPFKYEDFTSEQLESLKVKGDPGFTPDIEEYELDSKFLKEKQDERNFMNFLNENSSLDKNNYLTINADRDLNIELNLSETENYNMYFRKNSNDDFLKFRTVDLTSRTDSNKFYQNYDSTMLSGASTLSGSGDNFYTTAQGVKITFKFNGNGVKFRYYTDNRGGSWKASIDGEFVKNVSTHLNAQTPDNLLQASVGENEIAKGLDDGEHTLELEFIGADENNPVETPRGWIKLDTTEDDRNWETFEYSSISYNTVNVIYDSNKEFAFDVRYNDTREWIPEHNNVGTLKLSDVGKQYILLDGKEVSINTSATKTQFNELKIVQHLFGINSASGEKVCEVICISTITSRGVKFNTKFEWLKEVSISSGYVNMFTINPEFADRLVTSYGNEHDLNIYDNSYIPIEEDAPYGYIALSDSYPDFYITCDNINGYETLRMKYNTRDGDKYGNGLFSIQHRNEKLQKVYPKTYSSHTTSINEVYNFEGYFGFGKLPLVNKFF